MNRQPECSFFNSTSFDKESCAAGEAKLTKIDGETGQKYMEVAKLL